MREIPGTADVHINQVWITRRCRSMWTGRAPHSSG